MSIWSFLLAAAGPLALRVLATVGAVVVSVAGVDAGVQALIARAQSGYASMPPDVLQLASLAGVPEGLGLIMGAVAGRAALWAALSAARLAFSPAT